MIKFGPSGNCKKFYDQGNTGTLEAMKWLSDMGLNAFEYSFGRGVNISDQKAAQIGEEAHKFNIEISAHAPYYINFANSDQEQVEKSFAYIFRSCQKLTHFKGNRVVFHPSTVGKLTRKEAVDLTFLRIAQLVDKIYQNNLQNFIFSPETMGKLNQIGDLAEIVEFCKIDSCLVPAIDFGHLNARTFGGLKTVDDYDRIISYMLENLGFEKTTNMHVHFSKIEYSKGGEVRHLTFEDSVFGPEFQPLAIVLKKYNLTPFIICESAGTQAEDALYMKNVYENLHQNKEKQ